MATSVGKNQYFYNRAAVIGAVSALTTIVLLALSASNPTIYKWMGESSGGLKRWQWFLVGGLIANVAALSIAHQFFRPTAEAAEPFVLDLEEQYAATMKEAESQISDLQNERENLKRANEYLGGRLRAANESPVAADDAQQQEIAKLRLELAKVQREKELLEEANKTENRVDPATLEHVTRTNTGLQAENKGLMEENQQLGAKIQEVVAERDQRETEVADLKRVIDGIKGELTKLNENSARMFQGQANDARQMESRLKAQLAKVTAERDNLMRILDERQEEVVC